VSKAPAADQTRLLKVQEIDSRIDRAQHQREALPEAQRLAETREQLAHAEDAAATAHAELGDVQRDLTRIEDEIEKVKARQERDQTRLDSGMGQAKELQALSSELEALKKRLSELEDKALEVMERVEEAEHKSEAAQAAAQSLREQAGAQSAEVELTYDRLDKEMAAAKLERATAQDGLDEKLMALYERVRAKSGGIGAAPLRSGRCEGCHLAINPGDMSKIRQAAPDDVIRCEECGRILVRDEESGL
jgi:predicted  nucleic acid-binding Zn-ribbon protein